MCRAHGGSSPQVRAKAQQRLALDAVQADAAKVLAQEATVPLQDPLDELARLAAEAIGWKDALAARVNALADLRYMAPGAGTEQLRAEVVLMERAMDRAAKFADLLARHDWIGKKMELEQAQANQVVNAAGAGLNAVTDLTPRQRDLFLDGFLRALGRPGLAALVDDEGPVVRGELA